MTEQEYILRDIYRAIKAIVASSPIRVIGMQNRSEYIAFIEAKMEADIKQAKENKCRCADHTTNGRVFWMQRPSFRLGVAHADAYQVDFKYCPECGRKLLPNEKIGK
jgi:hypothetical protein